MLKPLITDLPLQWRYSGLEFRPNFLISTQLVQVFFQNHPISNFIQPINKNPQDHPLESGKSPSNMESHGALLRNSSLAGGFSSEDPPIEAVELTAFILVINYLRVASNPEKWRSSYYKQWKKTVCHPPSSLEKWRSSDYIHNSPPLPPLPAFFVPRICSSHQCLHCWCHRPNCQTRNGCCPAELGRWGAHHVDMLCIAKCIRCIHKVLRYCIQCIIHV